MEIKTRVYKNALYVILNGELDEHSSSYVRETLDKILEIAPDSVNSRALKKLIIKKYLN